MSQPAELQPTHHTELLGGKMSTYQTHGMLKSVLLTPETQNKLLSIANGALQTT